MFSQRKIMNGSSLPRTWRWLALALAAGVWSPVSTLAAEQEFTRPLSSLPPAIEALGEGWAAPMGVVIDDLSDPSKFSAEIKQFVEVYGKMFEEMGVHGLGNFVYQQKTASTTQVVTVWIVVFKDTASADAWWKERYEDANADAYEPAKDLGRRGVKAKSAAREAAQHGNVYISSHQLHEGDEYHRAIVHYLKQLSANALSDGISTIMPIVIVDGQEIEIGDQERLNGIEVARRAGVDVPHYCWHAGLSVVASCRMCLVETGTRDPKTGNIAMLPKLVPACQTPAKDGTVFVTDSDKIKQARAMVEEDLLIDHPIDCPICDKAGECLLQDYHFEHGQKEHRADIKPFTSRKREMGSTVTLFVDRCVMCSRCVRFCREVSGTSELMVINRGASEEIDVFPGHPLENKLSGNVVDLCPVGALGDKDFLYRQRVWFMKKHASVCTGCSTGCSINVNENQDTVHRLQPRENQHVNQWWMCDEGRYGFHHVHSPHRLVLAQHKLDDAHAVIDWQDLVQQLPERLKGAGPLAAVLSPHLTVEEAYLLATYIRSLDAKADLYLGPVPVQGEDERFPAGFVIHAEKCPNRRGVEEVLRHFMGRVSTFDDLLARLEGGNGHNQLGGLWVSGGYKTDWVDAATAERFAGLKELVVQDLFASPLMELATWRLPGAAFPEREGSYVNYQERLQSVRWAIRPPEGVWVEGQLYWRLLGRPGMVAGRKVLSELAAQIPYFAVAGGEVSDVGVDLRINQIAAAEASAPTA